MFRFDPSAYGTTVAPWLVRSAPNELGPGQPHIAARDALERLTDADLFAGQRIRDADMACCCRAALWLLHDFLDESHQISQQVTSTSGSYWHAIMHRREPDPGNSKYWWRRVGSHPVLARLVEEAPALGYDFRDPFQFVDFAERVRGSGTDAEEVAKRVQLLEWQLLFDHCYGQSVS